LNATGIVAQLTAKSSDLKNEPAARLRRI